MLVNSLDYLVNNLILIRVIDSSDLTANMLVMRLENCTHMGSLLGCLVNQDYQYEMVTSQATDRKHRMHQKD